MVLNFGDYKRILHRINPDGTDDNREIDATKDPQLQEKYQYDEEYFNRLVDNREFDKAVNYASQFMPKDNESRLNLEMTLNKIKNQGHIITEQYSRIEKDTDRDMVEFYDSVFKPNGLAYLSKNDYANNFSSLKDALFTVIQPNNSIIENFDSSTPTRNTKETNARYASIEFQPKKRSGIFGWDWTVADNTFYDIDSFYEQTGYNKNYLEQHGVRVSPKDGRTTLLFDKDNPLTNEIIYNYYKFMQRSDPRFFRPESLAMSNIHPKFRLVDGDNIDDESTLTYYQDNPEYIRRFAETINDAKSKKDALIASFGEKEFEFTSIIAPYSNDALRELQEEYHNSNGAMSYSEFNKRWKELGGDALLDLLAQSGTADQEMYSNYNNKEWTDETIEPLEQIDKSKVIQLIGANKDRVSEASMFLNGKFGTLITINGIAKPSKELNLKNDAEGELQDNRLQVFFPGIGQERAQAAIQRNTSTRAAQELNDMTNWEYTYELEDGSELMFAGKNQDGSSRFIHKDSKNNVVEEVDKTKAHMLLNESMIIESATRNLKYNYMNVNGKVIDTDGYETAARMTALQAAEELYPGLAIVDFDGNQYSFRDPAAIEAIFNHDIDENNIQYEMYAKLQEIYKVYDKVMRALYNYKY